MKLTFESKEHFYTKEQLKEQLAQMGLTPADTLMLHSSMKAIGPVEGGADTVVDAFMEYFRDGLFLTPAHTWKQMGPSYRVFDPASEPACVGIIPNIFLSRPGVVRSLHPTHSIAAYGPQASDYIRGEENLHTPCAPGGCWDRLRNVHAKILLAGVTHTRNTYIHSIEEVWDVPERLTAEPTLFSVRMPDGTCKPVSMYRHYNPNTAHISESFDKMKQGYFETGAARPVRLGDANCILCDAARLFEVTGRILSHDKNCFLDREEIPREWYL